MKEKSEKLENKRLAIIVMCAFAVSSASRMLHTASSESIRSEKRGFVHPLLGVHGHRLERSVYAFCIRCVQPFYPFGLESKEEEKI